MRKCLFFDTHAGSQLTFMTQNEKVLIFCYLRGVKTDLHDTEWESAHFSLPTQGHNWPFRCLDFPSHVDPMKSGHSGLPWPWGECFQLSLSWLAHIVSCKMGYVSSTHWVSKVHRNCSNIVSNDAKSAFHHFGSKKMPVSHQSPFQKRISDIRDYVFEAGAWRTDEWSPLCLRRLWCLRAAQGIIVWRISKIFDLLSYSKTTLDQSCLPTTLSSDKSEDIGVLSF